MGFLSDNAVPIGLGVLNFAGQVGTNSSNAEQAREQRAWEERMSNTAWQRGVADMRAAGLNPALAYEKGGASTPGASVAHMENAVGAGVSSALAAKTTKIQQEATQAQIDKTYADKANVEANTKQLTLESLERLALLSSQSDLNSANIAKSQADARLSGVDYQYLFRTLGSRIGLAKQQLAFTKNQAKGAGVDALLKGLAVPEAKARAEMWKSLVGKSILPWLGSAQQVLSMLPH